MIKTVAKTPYRFSTNSFRTILATSAAAIALNGAAFADDEPTSLEERVEALESKLDRILNRLEAQEATFTPEEEASLREASKIISTAQASGGQAPIMIAVETDTPGGVSAQKPSPPAKGFNVGDTNFTMKGYIKVDASITDFSGGELPSNNIGRDFYIPSLVPVGGSGDGADFDLNPRESRFIFAMDSERGGHDIGGVLEFDFQVTGGANERVSNSYVPRMRQAYITIDNWLIGQAWSTFQDVAALPDNLDFIGPTEGTTFIRQPMIRYSKGGWQIAVEQPETEVTTPTGGRVLPGDDLAPDVVVRYNHKKDWGHLTLAAIGRGLHVEDGVVPGALADTAFGYGISASGKLKVGEKDDFRFMATYGEGIGRYVGVNIVNDVAVNLDGKLQTIPTYSGFASYRHFWAPNLRSNFTGGYFKADNPVNLVGGGVTDEVYSAHVNLIYTPAPKIDVGIEYIHANRSLENGLDGQMNKVQFSTKYSF